MHNGMTHVGKALILKMAFQNFDNAKFYIALTTDASPPSADTRILSQLSQIPAGNGYDNGGKVVARDLAQFPTAGFDLARKRGWVEMSSQRFTAADGPLPSSGDGIKYAVLLADDPTVGNREVIAFAEVDGDPREVEAGQQFQVVKFRIILED